MRRIVVPLMLAAGLAGCGEKEPEVVCAYTPESNSEAAQNINQYRSSIAEKGGVCGIGVGIVNTLDALITRKKGEAYFAGVALHTSDYDEGFAALQVLDDMVLYDFDPEKTDWCENFRECEHDTVPAGMKLLVQKRPGVAYFEGQKLDDNAFYVFSGMGSYQTVSGASAQALVLKEVEGVAGCTARQLMSRQCP